MPVAVLTWELRFRLCNPVSWCCVFQLPLSNPPNLGVLRFLVRQSSVACWSIHRSAFVNLRLRVGQFTLPRSPFRHSLPLRFTLLHERGEPFLCSFGGPSRGRYSGAGVEQCAQVLSDRLIEHPLRELDRLG